MFVYSDNVITFYGELNQSDCNSILHCKGVLTGELRGAQDVQEHTQGYLQDTFSGAYNSMHRDTYQGI